MRTLVICLLAMLAAVQTVYAQPDRRDVRKGNRDFRNEDWNAAEIDYMKALNRDSSSVAALPKKQSYFGLSISICNFGISRR